MVFSYIFPETLSVYGDHWVYEYILQEFRSKKTTDFLVLSTRIFWKGNHLVSGFVTHVNHWVSVDIIFLIDSEREAAGFPALS